MRGQGSAASGRRWFFGPAHLGDYMRRWLLVTPWGSLRLHHILRSDDERALHDHPWNFVSILIAGTYTETLGVTIATLAGPATIPIRERCTRGRILRRHAAQLHRLEVPPGKTCWTLVLAGRVRRQWGFCTPEGWVSARNYQAANPDLPWDRYRPSSEAAS